MAKILVTPIATSGVEPFVMVGDLTIENKHGEEICYINGESFPAEIVMLLDKE